MDMPVVAATRLESDIGDIYLLARNRREVTVTGEILRIGRIRLANGEDHLALESGFSIFSGRIFGPHAFCEVECSPRLRPTGIESDMGNDLGNLRTGDAVLLGRLKMVNERIVRYTLTDKRGDRH